MRAGAGAGRSPACRPIQSVTAGIHEGIYHRTVIPAPRIENRIIVCTSPPLVPYPKSCCLPYLPCHPAWGPLLGA